MLSKVIRLSFSFSICDAADFLDGLCLFRICVDDFTLNLHFAFVDLRLGFLEEDRFTEALQHGYNFSSAETSKSCLVRPTADLIEGMFILMIWLLLVPLFLLHSLVYF